MKSNSAGPDFAADLAPQRGERGLGLRDELGDDGRIGLERGRRGAGRRTRGRLVGEQRDEAAVDDGLQRVTHQRLLPPDHGQEGAADRGRRQALRDVDEQPPAGLVHPWERDQLVHGEPQRLQGVGHHLLVTDGEVDVLLQVTALGDGEQRGDRPALDDLELVVGEAPLDVLRAAEARLDPAAELHELDGLRIRQRGLLAGELLADDLAVPHRVAIGVDLA